MPQEPVPSDDEIAQEAKPTPPVAPKVPALPVPAVKPVAPAPAPALAAKPATAPAQPITAAPGKPDTTQSRVDANGLSISWFWCTGCAPLIAKVRKSCRKTLRSQGYNAYIRSTDGKIGCLSVR